MKNTKRKKEPTIKNWHKVGLVLLVIATLAYIKISFFSTVEPTVTEEDSAKEQVTEQAPIIPKAYVNVFFIAQNDKKEEVYRAVKREYNEQIDGSKLKFSIVSLLKGPSMKEKTKGVYSEIPTDTKLLSIEEVPDKVSINLSGEFENGGGTDSLYKRLYQLIKTSNQNANTSVYLYINGKKADVIGGEGLMLSQPLNERSLEGED